MIVTITSSLPARAGGFVWFAFEAKNCATINDIHAALSGDGVLLGDRIDTIVQNGARRVTRRTPCLLGTAGVAMITPLHTEVVDEAGSPLA